MDELNKEQIQFLSKRFDLTEEEVIKHKDDLIKTLAFQFEELKLAVLKVWEAIKSNFFPIMKIYNTHKRTFNVKFYKKKCSQKKNWKKWRKRKF